MMRLFFKKIDNWLRSLRKQDGVSIVSLMVGLAVFSIFMLIAVALFITFFGNAKLDQDKREIDDVIRSISKMTDCCETFDHLDSATSTTSCTAINSQSAPYVFTLSGNKTLRLLRSNGQTVGTYDSMTGYTLGKFRYWVQCQGLLPSETGGPTARYLNIQLNSEANPDLTEYIETARICGDALGDFDTACKTSEYGTSGKASGGGKGSSSSSSTSGSTCYECADDLSEYPDLITCAGACSGACSTVTCSSSSSSSGKGKGEGGSTPTPTPTPLGGSNPSCDPTVAPTDCFEGKEYVLVSGKYYFANTGSGGTACTRPLAQFGDTPADCLYGDMWCPDSGGKVYSVATCAANCSVACTACRNTDSPNCHCSMSSSNRGTEWYLCTELGSPIHGTRIICGMEPTYESGDCLGAASCFYCAPP